MFWRKIFGSPLCVGEPNEAWKSHFGIVRVFQKIFPMLCLGRAHTAKIRTQFGGKKFSLCLRGGRKKFFFVLTACAELRKFLDELLRVCECFVWRQHWSIRLDEKKMAIVSFRCVSECLWKINNTQVNGVVYKHRASRLFMSICEVLRFVLVFSLASRKFLYVKNLLRFMLKCAAMIT